MRGVLMLALLLPATASAAEQVHLGIPGPDPSTELSVLWLEQAPLDEPSLLLRGPEGERTMAAELVPGPSAGFAYEARLTGLLPGEPYEYELGGRTFEVRTPPASLGPDDAVGFAATGDMGVRDQSRITAETIGGLDVDLVLHAGDISYAQGDPVGWASWFTMVEPVAARIPWVTALGNHETYVGPTALYNYPAPSEMMFYEQRFGLPNNEVWYSFDWAGIHIVGLDTYSSYVTGPDPDELAWLEQDLAAAADALWTVAFLHEPPYSSNNHGESERVQASFVPLFDRYGVDLVIGAHDHGYERSHLLRDGQVVDDDADFEQGQGAVYVVTGGGGQSLYDDWTDPPAWSAARGSFYHVTQCEATHTTLSCWVVPTGEDAIEDRFVIAKPGATTEAVGPDDAPGLGALLVLAVLAMAAVLNRTGRSRP